MSCFRKFLVLAHAILVFLCLQTSIYGDDSFRLCNKYIHGKDYVYNGLEKVGINLSMFDDNLITVKMQFLYHTVAQEPEEDGFFYVNSQILDLKMETEKDGKEIIPPLDRQDSYWKMVYKVKCNREGKPLEIMKPDGTTVPFAHSFRELNTCLFFEWPDEQVTIGDSWVRNINISWPREGVDGYIQAREIYKIISIEDCHGYRCAKIQCDLTYEGGVDSIDDQCITMKVSIKGKGFIYFAVEEGFPVMYLSATDILLDVGENQGGKMNIFIDSSLIFNDLADKQ